MAVFDGKQVLITGAAGDIGGEVARAFVAKGANVILADLDADKGVALAEQLGDARFVQLDVTTEASWAATMADVLTTGPLYGLVNAAGIFKPGIPFGEMSLDIWRQHFAVNLDGTFLGCRFGIEAMKGSGGGAIVNFSSGLAQIILTDGAPYCVSKAAVLSLTRVAARAGAKHKVRVNAVLPGAIDSEMMWRNVRDDFTKDDLMAMVLPQHPIGRIGLPSDVANAVAFLCDPASEFITAALLPVDGGQLIS